MCKAREILLDTNSVFPLEKNKSSNRITNVNRTKLWALQKVPQTEVKDPLQMLLVMENYSVTNKQNI